MGGFHVAHERRSGMCASERAGALDPADQFQHRQRRIDGIRKAAGQNRRGAVGERLRRADDSGIDERETAHAQSAHQRLALARRPDAEIDQSRPGRDLESEAEPVLRAEQNLTQPRGVFDHRQHAIAFHRNVGRCRNVFDGFGRRTALGASKGMHQDTASTARQPDGHLLVYGVV